MIEPQTLPPGTIGLSTINGHVGGFVRFGQLFAGASMEDSRWTHAFILGRQGELYEAMPAGIQCNPLQGYLDELSAGDEVMFIHTPLSAEQSQLVIEIGDDLVARKVGYSFLSYLYLFLKRLGLNTSWLRKKIAQTGDLICSQTVDHMLTTAGFEVFRDGRSYLDVIPSDFPGLIRSDDRFKTLLFNEENTKEQ